MPMRAAATFVLTAAMTLPLSTPATETDPALFELDGTVYRAGDLSARMRQLYASILTDHHREMRDLVDEMVFDVYVEREAERHGGARQDGPTHLPTHVAERQTDEDPGTHQSARMSAGGTRTAR